MQTLEDLARTVATRFSSVIPDGFVVSDERGNIIIRATADPLGQESHLADLVTQAPNHESLTIGILNVLITIQDYVSETLTIPWPSSDSEMALPDAVCEEGTLRFWYGGETKPVLAFDPIDVSSLLE